MKKWNQEKVGCMFFKNPFKTKKIENKIFEFYFEIKNETTKNIYLEPNGFAWPVVKGDTLRVTIDQSWLPHKFYDRRTPFGFTIDNDSIIFWFDVLPEKVWLNEKVIS